MSLSWLLRIVAFFAVACAAIAQPSAPWLAATVSLMFVLLVAATVQAVGKQRGSRFAIGFCLSKPASSEADSLDDLFGDSSGGYGSGGGGYGYGGGYGGGYGRGNGAGGYGGGYGGPPPEVTDLPLLSPLSRYMHVTHCMWTIAIAMAFGVLTVRRPNSGQVTICLDQTAVDRGD